MRTLVQSFLLGIRSRRCRSENPGNVFIDESAISLSISANLFVRFAPAVKTFGRLDHGAPSVSSPFGDERCEQRQAHAGDQDSTANTRRSARRRLRPPPSSGCRPRRRLDRHGVAGLRRSPGGERHTAPARCKKRRARSTTGPAAPPVRCAVGTSQAVGVVIPDLENPFFTAVVRGIELVLQAAGYTLLLANSDEDTTRERNILETLRADGVAGIIFVPINAARDAYRRRAGAAAAGRCRRSIADHPAVRPGHGGQRRGHPTRRRASAGAGPSRRRAARRPVATQHRQGTRARLRGGAARRRPADPARAGALRRFPRGAAATTG